ncbi:Phospholipid-transporting ATPase IA [Ilyodon furcidens]|uniref:Phospholipid-transporting ATPase IA n=1 Tax=Ilyodon furcidens TaxID=33524 RepID=A0ABV0T6W6_9TELE
MMFSSGVFWMGLFFIPVTSLIFDVAYKAVKKACFKTLVDEVQELEALSKDPGAVVHGKSLTERAQLLKNVFKKSTVPLYRSESMQQNLLHGYAFSQDENGVVSQSEVIRAYDTTKQRTNECRSLALDLESHSTHHSCLNNHSGAYLKLFPLRRRLPRII